MWMFLKENLPCEKSFLELIGIFFQIFLIGSGDEGIDEEETSFDRLQFLSSII
jgi:hypothetical protein